QPYEKLTIITPEVSVKNALQLLNDTGYLSLPVVKDQKFYGAITKERIYSFYFESSGDKKTILEDFTVEQMLRKDIPTIEPSKEVEKAVSMLQTM
uniref:CBS domain-containing protein n=1 Tax=Clostridium polynesiense TaxID=1325933 RepID=UPI001FA7ECD2